MHGSALGSTDYETVMNGGNLQSYGSAYTLSERITCNGGRFSAWGYTGNPSFNIAGHVTVNSNVEIRAGTDISYSIGTLELSGFFDGAGGLTRITGQNTNYVYVTGDTNTYTGPTIINSGAALWVGKPNLYSGVLGCGAVTNSGTLYAYSSRLCCGPLVNWGTLYCNTGVVSLGSVANGGKLYLMGGLLGTGSVVNSGSLYCFMPSLGAGDVTNTGTLYFDATNAEYVVTNTVYGSGTALLRYGSSVALAGYYTNAYWRVGMGTLTLTNGATVFAGSSLSIADRQSMGYSPDPSNVVATLNICDGSSLTMTAMSAGNGSGGCMTGIVNQTGGSVLTTGWTGDPTHFAGEYDGLHLGHYPAAYTEWNISGGTLTVDNGYRLAIAIDGTGVLHQTGGQIYCQSVVVNARDANPGGSGRLTLEGGALNVGSNGITAGVGAGYLVQYGGMGGVVRAMTNFTSSLNATLFGSNENAVTFDTTNWTITLAGKLTGTGGLNKLGTGDLVLSGVNTYSGPTRVMEGAVVPTSATALSTNSVVAFCVAADGAGGRLSLPDGFSLAGLTVGVANPEALDEHKEYVVATWSGTLGGAFGASALPGPWYVYYDWDNRVAKLRAAIGTLIRVR